MDHLEDLGNAMYGLAKLCSIVHRSEVLYISNPWPRH